MTTGTASTLLELFRANFPDIEDKFLNFHAEAIASKAQESAEVIIRVLSVPGASTHPTGLIRQIIQLSSPMFDEDEFEPTSYFASFWSSPLSMEIAQMHAFESIASLLGMQVNELIMSEATTSLIHNQLLQPFRRGNEANSYWYWSGVALLHFYIKDTEKRDALTPKAVMGFVWWIGEQEELKAVTDLLKERPTIDVKQLEALLSVRSSLAPSLTTGAL